MGGLRYQNPRISCRNQLLDGGIAVTSYELHNGRFYIPCTLEQVPFIAGRLVSLGCNLKGCFDPATFTVRPGDKNSFCYCLSIGYRNPREVSFGFSVGQYRMEGMEELSMEDIFSIKGERHD